MLETEKLEGRVWRDWERKSVKPELRWLACGVIAAQCLAAEVGIPAYSGWSRAVGSNYSVDWIWGNHFQCLCLVGTSGSCHRKLSIFFKHILLPKRKLSWLCSLVWHSNKWWHTCLTRGVGLLSSFNTPITALLLCIPGWWLPSLVANDREWVLSSLQKRWTSVITSRSYHICFTGASLARLLDGQMPGRMALWFWKVVQCWEKINIREFLCVSCSCVN